MWFVLAAFAATGCDWGSNPDSLDLDDPGKTGADLSSIKAVTVLAFGCFGTADIESRR